MQYYRLDSEELDLLRSSVKRSVKKHRKKRFQGTDLITNSKHIREFYQECDVIPRRDDDIQYSSMFFQEKEKNEKVFKKAEKSASIEMDNNRIDKHYSDLSFSYQIPRQVKNKQIQKRNAPLVQVTVVPKSIYTRTTKPYRRKVTPHLFNRFSNQETFFTTKNVYVVVKDRKNKKVYEVNTTGSAMLINNELFTHENEQLATVDSLIDSIDMQRKRKKNKVDVPRDVIVQRYVSMKRPVKYSAVNKEENNIELANRVKIMGRVDLNEDDRYVLKCAATVNDKPILTQHEGSSSFALRQYKKSTDRSRPLTMSERNNIQNLSNNAIGDTRNTNDFHRNETQGTQVNMTSRVSRRDQMIQCDCKSSPNCFTFRCSSKNDTQKNVLNDCESLVVVISVQPKNMEGDKIDKFVDTDDQNLCDSQGHICDDLVTVENSKTTNVNLNFKANKARTFSPPVKLSSVNKRNDIEHVANENEQLKHNICDNFDYEKVKPDKRNGSKSPNRVRQINTFQEKTNSPVRGTDFSRRNFNTFLKNQDYKQKQCSSSKLNYTTSFRQRSWSPPNTLEAQHATINKDSSSVKRITGHQRNISPIKKYTKNNTNKQNVRAYENDNTQELLNISKNNSDMIKITKHKTFKSSKDTVAKKQFIKKIKQKLENDIPSNNVYPVENTSSVSVDVGAQDEHFNFQYRQGALGADMKERKTNKISACGKINTTSRPSMYSYLMIPQSRVELFSQTMFDISNTPTPSLMNFNKSPTIRDSLEISQSREKKGTKEDAFFHLNLDENSNKDVEYSVPMKHYRGDKCSITDPFQRDLEIRELLGVAKTSKNKVSSESSQNGQPKMMDESQQIVLQDTRICESFNPTIFNIKNSDKKGTRIQNICPQLKMKNSTITKKSDCTQYDIKTLQKSILLKEEKILKYNMEMLQKLTKHRSIILTRKQYEKVRRALQNKISKKGLKSNSYKKNSFVSVGMVTKRLREMCPVLHYDKDMQTDPIIIQCKHTQKTGVTHEDAAQSAEPVSLPLISDDKIDKEIARYSNVKEKSTSENRDIEKYTERDNGTFVCVPRNTVSSLEIHYASVAYLKHVTFSDVSVADIEKNPNVQDTTIKKDSVSTHTLYRHKKCVTPNLGTSAVSLMSENDSLYTDQPALKVEGVRTRKSFLKRLMSCLAMKSNRASESRLGVRPALKARSIDSMISMDSYYINTSLGAMEITSSLYDTSVSFFTNHTVFPTYSKAKRGGLFSSFRGLLFYRKS